MALNKFMHPRNIYRDPPDFAKLAKSYPEFASIAKVDGAGKVHIDFKDPKSLRVLTKYLLKSDFNIDIVIPEDRLVPTLPLRLNYILWIEDLIQSTMANMDLIKGLDIGTGACAIYPMLASVKNKWCMTGTDTDDKSIKMAEQNIARNNLQNVIKVVKNETNTLVEFLFTKNNEESFDFCMCNPPFYSSIQELCESRSTARPPPKNAFTGSPQELITEGGELEFIRRLIAESKSYKNNIKIFTTMVGHKYNLKELVQDLKTDCIKHTDTEFCQGRVTRWGLAWTYNDYNFKQIDNSRNKCYKKAAPITFVLPQIADIKYDIENCLKKIKTILHCLDITHNVLTKKGTYYLFEITALRNTWCNQRRKRRQQRKQDPDDAKRSKTSNEDDSIVADNHIDANEKCLQDKTSLNINGNKDPPSLNTTSTENDETKKTGDEVHRSETSIDVVSYDNVDNDEQLAQGTKMNGSPDPLVKGHMKLFKKENNIILEFEYLNGISGKEGLHQIVQYVKNNWK